MAPKFGTSGLRGLVTELTPDCVGAHVAGFARACHMGNGLYIGHDLRDSSSRIAAMVAETAQAAGLTVTDCGAVPTPALALAAMEAEAAAVMVTGSHIPADRNGLKFYTPDGEITKRDEQAILAALGETGDAVPAATIKQRTDVGARYAARYRDAFGRCLQGMRLGLYAHSAVGASLMQDLLLELGAEVDVLGRSEIFVPVDTEAVSPSLRAQLRDWAGSGRYDAILSTDADGDRPLLTDAAGEVVRGDILGQITAAALGAEMVITPVSSNTGAEAAGQFTQVIRTCIGSPYVIAGMADAGGRVVGYEANGGFLLGYAADAPVGTIAPLMTRDALLPILAVLHQAQDRGVADLVAAQPPRFTASDRLQEVPTEVSQQLVRKLSDDPTARATFLSQFGIGSETSINTLDGLRITLSDKRIVHLRPSGNAPELRLYTEAESKGMAQKMLDRGLDLLRKTTG